MSNFTNSPLATYKRISPNRNSPRTEDKITKIIVHHMAGVGSVESFGEIVASEARQMSANYAIGNDGRIGLYCEEKDRCWCSSSRWADNRGIAIEVSNSKLGEPWPVSTKAWNSLVNLCADICKRNGIPKMTYTGDTNGVLMFHRWFAATGCVPIDTTEVLTREGWIPIRDVKVGDVIATVYPKDTTIRFDRVENMTPVHKDTVFTTNHMTITREHRVLYSDSRKMGLSIDEYQKICDQQFAVLNAGTYNAGGMDISASEMIFLLEMQRIGVYNEKDTCLEFTYIKESRVQYFYGLLVNLDYKFTKVQDDLGPVRFTIYDQRAWDLCKTYLSGKDFNWKWLEMNPTQFSYFIYKATSHVDTGWDRKYVSDSMVNIDVIQALCAFNERGTLYVESENALYVEQGFRMINPRDVVTTDDVEVACVTVKSGCFLMRQHGMTTLTGNCPGEYLFSRAQQLCDEVNAKLGSSDEPVKPDPKPSDDPVPVDLAPGVLVSIKAGATYYNGGPIPPWVMNQRWYVSSVSGDRAVINQNESKNAAIESAINTKYLTVVQNAGAPIDKTFTPYIIPLSMGTQIYQIVGDKLYAKEKIKVSSKYTIVQEMVVTGTKMGLLKSGAGWVKLGISNDTDTTINPGDTVEVLKNELYGGGTFTVYEKDYKVLRVNGDRVVISSDGKNVTAAVKASNLRKK